MENQQTNYGQKSIDTLKTVNAIILIVGIIASVTIWLTMSTMQDPSYLDRGGSIVIYKKIANQQGIILGFEILFTTILIWSFIRVICSIAENIIGIRVNAEKGE